MILKRVAIILGIFLGATSPAKAQDPTQIIAAVTASLAAARVLFDFSIYAVGKCIATCCPNGCCHRRPDVLAEYFEALMRDARADMVDMMPLLIETLTQAVKATKGAARVDDPLGGATFTFPTAQFKLEQPTNYVAAASKLPPLDTSSLLLLAAATKLVTKQLGGWAPPESKYAKYLQKRHAGAITTLVGEWISAGTLRIEQGTLPDGEPFSRFYLGSGDGDPFKLAAVITHIHTAPRGGDVKTVTAADTTSAAAVLKRRIPIFPASAVPGSARDDDQV